MLAICTRTRNEDYEFKGDVNAYNNFKERINRFNFLYDTTKPLVMLDEEYLFIAGIATGRKDKVNTIIRYSLFYSGEKSRVLFNRFREALKKDNAKTLGDKLDTLLMLNNELGSLDFNMPDEKAFLRILDTVLPKNSQTQTSDFAIWTTFCPSERSDQAFENFLLSKPNLLPHYGTIEVESLTPQNFSELAQKKTSLPGRSMVKSAMILLCGMGMGFLCVKLAETYAKPSESEKRPLRAIEIQAQKRMEEHTPQATGVIILRENQLTHLPTILKEKNLQQIPCYQEMHLQIPGEAAKEVILIPVYSPIQKDQPISKNQILRQEGPIYLLPRKEMKQKELPLPTMTIPATNSQEAQKTPAAMEISSQNSTKESRAKKAKKK